jgi:DNA-directed RNA polymerase subunit RPC12/RpoP
MVSDSSRQKSDFIQGRSITVNKREIEQIIQDKTVWDHFVGSQTPEEFMSFKPNSSIETAVNDYAKEATDIFKDLDEEATEMIKDALIEEIEQAFTDNCPHCSEPIRLDENREARCEGCHWRTMILPRDMLNKMLNDGQILFSDGKAIEPITYIQRPCGEDSVVVSLPDLDNSVLETLKEKAPGTAQALRTFLTNEPSWEEKNLLRQFRSINIQKLGKKASYLKAKRRVIEFLQGQVIK